VLVEKKPQQVAQPESAKEAVNRRPIAFTLHCWRVSREVLVLDTHQPDLALPVERLLLNIVSCRLGVQQLPKREVVRWPLFKQDQQAQDEAQARAMVHAYIAAQHAKAPIEQLWLFGRDAALYALNTFDDLPVYGSVCVDTDWGLPILALPGLADLLQSPLDKALVWKGLAALCQY